MNNTDILHLRLANQQIANTNFKTPAEIVHWLGAMQAQEYAISKWAIGLRLPHLKETDVEKTFNEGAILRTHLLRPTWHFVTPQDIRWMLALTAPRVNAFNAYYYRKEGLDNKVFKRSNDALIKTLQGGKQLIRTAIKAALERAKIKADGLKFGLLLMRAELDGIICSGPRQGKQFTYALLEERVPKTKALDRAEALAALTKRYFTSRGPAMLQDFAWWSGLSMKEVKEGVGMLPSNFVHETINGKEYVFTDPAKERTTSSASGKLQSTFLMPDYDEYGISYKDRTALSSWPAAKGYHVPPVDKRGGDTIFNRMIIADGRIAGVWKPLIKNKSIEVESILFIKLSKLQQQAVKKAIDRYKEFVGGSRLEVRSS